MPPGVANKKQERPRAPVVKLSCLQEHVHKKKVLEIVSHHSKYVWLLCIEKVQNQVYVMEWVFLSGVCAGTKIRLTAIGGTPEAGRSRDPHQASSLVFTLASSRSFLLISYEKSFLFINIASVLIKFSLILFTTAYSIGMYYHDVAVIGDSFVNRLRNDRAIDRNLDLPHQIKVRWYTQGGLTIARMDSTFDCIARDFQQIAILQIGSNDLCQQSSKVFIDNLCTRIIPRLKDLGCKVIVLCQLFHRRPGK